MILEQIQTPADVKRLNNDEVRRLCQELRGFLISRVSQTGGHLASNLGVVELTVAIHRVFDTSRDRLVFDVGHQCYVHKALTGRQALFETLRQFGGLSGFPKPYESEHDAFIAGHASNSVSVALGMARARTLRHEDYSVLALIGAVMVLFLFVVMMLDINFEKLREGFWRNLPLAGTVAAIMVAEMTLILVSPDVGLSNFKEPAALAADYSNVKDLGRQIYTTYLYPFELAAVLLLLAIVAAIALTMRKRKDNKWVDPAEQVKVRRNDRIRMVKMAAEPRVVRGGETDNDNNAAA